MAKDNIIGLSMNLDVTDLKTGIKQVNKLIKDSKSEFEHSTAGLDKWSKSSDGLTAKIKQLNKQLDAQKKAVNGYQAEIKRVSELEGDHREELSRLNESLLKFETEVKKTEQSISHYSESLNSINYENKKANSNFGKLTQKIKDQKEEMEKLSFEYEDAVVSYGKNSKEAKELARRIKSLSLEISNSEHKVDGAKQSFKELEIEMKSAEQVAESVQSAMRKFAMAVGAIFTSIIAVSEGTKEFRTNMSKLDTAFESSGLTADQAGETYKKLYGIVADEGKATEASALISKIAHSEQDLAHWTNILTGVYAQFGDSLPIESLAEASNETIKVGKVTGVLADALNWVGKSEDDVNKELAKMNKESERNQYITETLNELYYLQADRYRELNSEIIENNEAQVELNDEMAKVGELAEPVAIELKKIGAELLESMMPILEDLIGFLRSIVDWFSSISTFSKKAIITMIGITAVIGPLMKAIKALKQMRDMIFAIKALSEGAKFGLIGLAGAVGVIGVAGITSSVINSKQDAYYDNYNPNIQTPIQGGGRSSDPEIYKRMEELKEKYKKDEAFRKEINKTFLNSKTALLPQEGVNSLLMIQAQNEIKAERELAKVKEAELKLAEEKNEKIRKQIILASKSNSDYYAIETEYAKVFIDNYLNIPKEMKEELEKGLEVQNKLIVLENQIKDATANKDEDKKLALEREQAFLLLEQKKYKDLNALREASSNILYRGTENLDSFKNNEKKVEKILEDASKIGAEINFQMEKEKQELEKEKQGLETKQEDLNVVEKLIKERIETLKAMGDDITDAQQLMLNNLETYWEFRHPKTDSEGSLDSGEIAPKTQEELAEERKSLEETFKENFSSDLESVYFDTWADGFANLFGEATALANAFHQEELNNIDKELQALENEKNVEGANIEEIEAKQKELLAEKNRIAKKQFQAEKANNIASAISNGAIAIVRGFADLGPIGGGINAGIQAVITALQVATIASQKFVPMMAKGGVVDNPTLAMVGEAGKEAVMPLENNTGWISDLAFKLNEIMKKDLIGGVSGGTNYYNTQTVNKTYVQNVYSPEPLTARDLYNDGQLLLAIND